MTRRRDVPLAPLTTLGIGGLARELVRITTVAELRELVRDARAEPLLILGGGSNLVVRDAGWPGVVAQIAIGGIEIRDDLVAVGAGVAWDDLVAQMVIAGRAGIESMSGIPGLVGATPMQNVGAYGQEVSDTIACVHALDRSTGELVAIAPADCAFAYRTSVFKGSARWIITGVDFRLPTEAIAPLRYAELAIALGADRAPLAQIRDTVIALRRA